MRIATKQEYGNYGEHKVAKQLEDQGFIIHAQNFKVRGGEIDIIAQKHDVYAFVEVKSRSRNPNFSFSELITAKKQALIIRTARHYLVQHKISYDDHVIRFDVAFVCDNTIEYHENAFTAPSSHT